MNILDMVLYVRNRPKLARPLLVQERLVADTKYTLGLFADEEKLTSR
jgi:hypothetical protein